MARTSVANAEHKPGLLVGLAHRGEREGRRLGRARALHSPLQTLGVAFVQRRGRRHQPVGDLDASAGKDEFSGHKPVPLVTPAEENLRHRLGAIDQNKRGRIPRFYIGKGLVAHRVNQSLSTIGHGTGHNHAFAFVFHEPLPRRPLPSDLRAIFRFGWDRCPVPRSAPDFSSFTSRKRKAPATGAASTSSTVTGSPSRYVSAPPTKAWLAS